MPLIDYVDPDGTTGRTREILRRRLETSGRYSLMDRVLAHNPVVLEATANHFGAVLSDGRLDRRLKELVFVTVSIVNGCEYCATTHTQALAERFGVPRSAVDAIEAGETIEDERDDAVVAFARTMATDPRRVSADDVDRLREVGFDEAAIVELVTTVAAGIEANAITDALNVHPGDYDDGTLDPYRFGLGDADHG